MDLRHRDYLKVLSVHFFYIHSFYIMLTGKTSVYIDTQKSDDDPPPEMEKETPEVVESAGEDNESAHEKERKVQETNQTRRKPLDRSKYGKFIIHYGMYHNKSLLFS